MLLAEALVWATEFESWHQSLPASGVKLATELHWKGPAADSGGLGMCGEELLHTHLAGSLPKAMAADCHHRDGAEHIHLSNSMAADSQQGDAGDKHGMADDSQEGDTHGMAADSQEGDAGDTHGMAADGENNSSYIG